MKMMNTKGSALIITLLVITVLAGIAFASSRLTFSELNQSVNLEDSEIAYQAAESGIEMGLLMYRYDKGITFQSNDSQEESYYRFNINQSREVDSNETVAKNESYFDLMISNQNDDSTESVEALECDQKMIDDGQCIELVTGDYIIPAIEKNNVVEYDFSSDYYEACLYAHPKITGNFENNNGQLEIIYSYDQDLLSGDQLDDEKQLIDAKQLQLGEYFDESKINLLKKIRIKALSSNLIDYEIQFQQSCNPPSRYTKITSIGYFANSKRKLEVTLDNATGALSTPFDFLILTDN